MHEFRSRERSKYKSFWGMSFPRSLASVPEGVQKVGAVRSKETMKSRGGTSPPSFLFFRAPFYFAPLPTIWTPGTGYTKSAHTKMLCVFFSCLSVGAIFERNFPGLILFKGWDLKSSSRKAKGFENSRILSNLEEVRLKLNARYPQEEV